MRHGSTDLNIEGKIMALECLLRTWSTKVHCHHHFLHPRNYHLIEHFVQPRHCVNTYALSLPIPSVMGVSSERLSPLPTTALTTFELSGENVNPFLADSRVIILYKNLSIMLCEKESCLLTQGLFEMV